MIPQADSTTLISHMPAGVCAFIAFDVTMTWASYVVLWKLLATMVPINTTRKLQHLAHSSGSLPYKGTPILDPNLI